MPKRAPLGPSRFRQGDVTRAILATEKAGKAVVEIRIEPDGAVRIITGEGTPEPARNPWDEALS